MAAISPSPDSAPFVVPTPPLTTLVTSPIHPNANQPEISNPSPPNAPPPTTPVTPPSVVVAPPPTPPIAPPPSPPVSPPLIPVTPQTPPPTVSSPPLPSVSPPPPQIDPPVSSPPPEKAQPPASSPSPPAPTPPSSEPPRFSPPSPPASSKPPESSPSPPASTPPEDSPTPPAVQPPHGSPSRPAAIPPPSEPSSAPPPSVIPGTKTPDVQIPSSSSFSPPGTSTKVPSSSLHGNKSGFPQTVSNAPSEGEIGSVGAIAIGVITGALMLGLIGLVALLMFKRKKRSSGAFYGHVIPASVGLLTRSGRFDCVFKGHLVDGRLVGVKQLLIGSGQGEREFKTEVEIVAISTIVIWFLQLGTSFRRVKGFLSMIMFLTTRFISIFMEKAGQLWSGLYRK